MLDGIQNACAVRSVQVREKATAFVQKHLARPFIAFHVRRDDFPQVLYVMRCILYVVRCMLCIAMLHVRRDGVPRGRSGNRWTTVLA